MNTRMFVVPRSMPSLGEKKDILHIVSLSAPACKDARMPHMEEGIHFIVDGGRKLSGSVETSRSKNGAVALLAASLLNNGRTTLEHMPKIEEVNRLIEVLRSIGVSAEWRDTSVIIMPPEKISLDAIDRVSAMKTRSILMFIGPLVHLFKKFDLPQSGGCTLGTRTVRPHLFALEKFGVSVKAHSGSYHAEHTVLRPAEVILFESSDTATETALFAAARISGKSVIKYASANYQVQEVCGFLRALGVTIDGIGSTTLTVHGVANIHTDVAYSVAEDPIDSMFFIATAIVTRSKLTITNAPIEFLEIELAILEKMGLLFSLTNPHISENGITKLVDIHIEPSKLVAFPEKIHARPYPGLNMDNLPFFAVIATQANGTTLIHDWVFDKRAIYYSELDRLGAQTLLHDPHRISISGPTALKAAEIVCPTVLRIGAMLVVAMLGAEGRSTLRNVYSINRGYEDIVQRLRKLGANISEQVY
ncbi:UDP-N-acetylglucosamine 1-carboxyvinyltransferase [Candidatus Kaiserbacteria bacterium CG08_land_8_20_14_0_20_50_21]|uniref:UDP-N-acetylglucosamine 1-carboxyvinyltransferase n=1 Tax=Candidatus Kaiserbacteria bacterium CG08_land_8_20_14_0_20_50_21 TaxID=1974604 RepID=A0A2H0YXB7_9BACT|nr:MAG: UDP-N-acetylglucosamine 1-carboxyvinyltransferase [Candidatus Kaiserbacteria bacterium CG08_land_8_20_14_0_20_50_21]PJA01147.1 MAG: UDP-N-acetylglucosamine 1-carboxyvinyltransferase [Candidatus Kaiserbacteria bacterium CG_4_10_14_0_2_um_filter_50_16]